MTPALKELAAEVRHLTAQIPREAPLSEIVINNFHNQKSPGATRYPVVHHVRRKLMPTEDVLAFLEADPIFAPHLTNLRGRSRNAALAELRFQAVRFLHAKGIHAADIGNALNRSISMVLFVLRQKS